MENMATIIFSKDTILSLIFNYYCDLVCFELNKNLSYEIPNIVERPIDTNENDAKLLTSIQLIPNHMQKQIQMQKQQSYITFDNDNNNKNWDRITNKYYTINMNNGYQMLFEYVITNNLNVPLLIFNELNTHYEADKIDLCKNAKRILNEENAGGSSSLSEAFSYEILSKCFNNVTLYKTEMEIKYWWNAWKKTDYIVYIKNNNNENIKCAVSVTRAMKYIVNEKYTLQDALRLLNKKLNTVNESFKGVLLEDEWQTQILHIFCQDLHIANVISYTFRWLQFTDPYLCSNTILFITITNKNCHSIYFQRQK